MKLLSFLLLLGSAAIAHCYTVNGTTFTTDGSVGDANNAELAAALSRLLAVATHFNGLPERKRNSARCSALSALSSMAKQTSP